jgi:MerR family transcriptional regulator, copper efflux regulator
MTEVEPNGASAPGCTTCGRTGVELGDDGRCVRCSVDGAALTEGQRRGLRLIGDVAQQVGLSLRTVRYYEEAGLVRPVARTSGGFRLYDDDAIARFRLIMQMKPLGFSLEEMRRLLEARQSLADGGLSPEDHHDARERLSLFSTAAEEKCRTLRSQLEVAESFVLTLREEARRLDPAAMGTDPDPA